MKIIEALLLSEHDLLETRRPITIAQINPTCFTLEARCAIERASIAVYTDSRTLHSRLIKDRYGDRGTQHLHVAFEAGRTYQDRVYGEGVENLMAKDVFSFESWFKHKTV